MSREAACAALFSLISGAYVWGMTPARRLKLWADVPASSRPAFFQLEDGRDRYAWQNLAIPKRSLDVKLFFYIAASDSNPGGSQLNAISDAVDAALASSLGDLSLGRQTASGTAYSFKVKEVLLRDPGDLDGDGILVMTVEITLP